MSPTHPVHTAAEALERLPRLPGGSELLAAAARREDLALVGGAVRDLLLGHWPRELDVTVARDATGLAAELAASVSPSERPYGHAVEPLVHERFGTASVVWSYGRIDIAERRVEVYPSPGALPEVRPGGVEEDLARRDFTVNAIALPLAGPGHGQLQAVEHALEDLEAHTLRVLHDASFREDPTRILRLARYAARLRFAIEERTRSLAEQALAQGALDTVSGGRIGSELWLAAREADGRAAFRSLGSLGVLAALGMPAPFDDALAEEAAALLPADGSQELMVMGIALAQPAEDATRAARPPTDVMSRLEFTREQERGVDALLGGATVLAERILERPPGGTPVWFDGATTESVAVAGALAARKSAHAAQPVAEWFDIYRHVTLDIDGSDLLAAGVPEGPEVGSRLLLALQRKREGRAAGREQQLRAALDSPPGALDGLGAP
ncbi:MAG: tRNA nucleotidyltransferase/poly(A) polymerase family protein [Solirubrobacteraceae bacterium]